ncbi:MAG TPA: PucR family transcriptional regulator ligand-binding domain-containing protein, partial [Ornithinibacter sp.]|nr:PucR family transcriptional regulator ligand-binding domain-containing protein [Ornithinibacter sp.]
MDTVSPSERLPLQTVALPTLAEVLEMPLVRAGRVRVLAGEDALDRAVHWVHPAELTDIAPLLRGGELVLTTGIALPEDPAGLATYATSLAGADAAGLLVELGRRWPSELPASLVEACRASGLPLVTLQHEVPFARIAQVLGERIVDARLAELQAVEHLHEVFTDLTLDDAGPTEVLEAVHRISGRTVVLEDEQHRVLDYVLAADTTGEWLDGWERRSRRVDVPGRTGWDAAQEALVTAVGRPGRATGRLLLHASTAPPARFASLLERAAATIAVQRAQARDRDTLVRRTHLALVLGLLADPTSPDLPRRCELAGLPVSRRTLVGVSVRPVSAPTAEVLAAVIAAGHQLRLPLVAAGIDRDVRVLLSMRPGDDQVAVTEALLARVGALAPVRMPAGRAVHDLGHVD